MRRVVVLDTGPLGMIVNPSKTPASALCERWARDLLAVDLVVSVPEIADYEIRRELIRRGSTSGLSRLDRLQVGFKYLPLTTDAMLLAAELWARARQGGKPTAGPESLDADCILAAQAITSGGPDDEVIVATTNVGHIARFLEAKVWEEIAP